VDVDADADVDVDEDVDVDVSPLRRFRHLLQLVGILRALQHWLSGVFGG